MERKSIPDAENRLLTLYAIERLGSVTAQQLLRFMTALELMDYFTLQLGLSEMQEQGELQCRVHPLGHLFSLTEAGTFTLREFELRIPQSRRSAVDAAAGMWNERFRTEQQTPAESKKLASGETILHLRLLEGELTLLDLLYTLPAGTAMHSIHERWMRCSASVYAGILDRLMRGDPPVSEEWPKDVLLETRSAGDWLLSMTGGTEAEPMFLLLSLPDEQVARTCACHWAQAADSIRQLIIAGLEQADRS